MGGGEFGRDGAEVVQYAADLDQAVVQVMYRLLPGPSSSCSTVAAGMRGAPAASKKAIDNRCLSSVCYSLSMLLAINTFLGIWSFMVVSIGLIFLLLRVIPLKWWRGSSGGGGGGGGGGDGGGGCGGDGGGC